jgi:hypothetical protein
MYGMIVKNMNDSKEHECYTCNKIFTCKYQYEIICSCLGVALNGGDETCIEFFCSNDCLFNFDEKEELIEE